MAEVPQMSRVLVIDALLFEFIVLLFDLLVIIILSWLQRMASIMVFVADS